jgi:hypothetical protein
MGTFSNSLALAATLLATIAFIPQQANAERVCRQDCVGPVCKEQCVESRDRDRDQIRTESRDHDQIETEGRSDRGKDREDSRDRNPGVELKAPGVGVEIGR